MSAPVEAYPETYYRTRNYQNYLTRKFTALAEDIVFSISPPLEHCSSVFLDFGCGYGGLLNAFDELGWYGGWGTDISQWAIEEGHRRFPKLQERLQFYNRDLLRRHNNVILMLDVLEHMPEYEIESVLKLARKGCVNFLVARIPVCASEGEPFILPVSNNDPTHITCHTKVWWQKRFMEHDFTPHSYFSGNAIYDSPGVLACLYK